MNAFNAETTMMTDTIETIGKGSLIQHGKFNDRVYLMKLNQADTDIILKEINLRAQRYGYSKLFCKIPKRIAASFLADGYILEGYIPNFYNGREDAFFMSKFLSSNRLLNIHTQQLQEFNQLLAQTVLTQKKGPTVPTDYKIRKLGKKDIPQMTAIYADIFKSYPFPIHDPAYISETMDENVHYFGAFKGDTLGALASSEVNVESQNAEMTDFATHKAHTGNHLSCLLLDTMEEEMRQQGIKTLYTIARLNSIPMNKTFLRSGYEYSGTLLNNTNIAGEIESMNLYYKQI